MRKNGEAEDTALSSPPSLRPPSTHARIHTLTLLTYPAAGKREGGAVALPSTSGAPRRKQVKGKTTYQKATTVYGKGEGRLPAQGGESGQEVVRGNEN